MSNNENESLFSDNEDPTISSMPSDITQNTDSGSATAVVTWSAPSASDNSGTVDLTSSRNSGGAFPIGSTAVTYTAVDPSANSVNATFTITIEGINLLRISKYSCI